MDDPLVGIFNKWHGFSRKMAFNRQLQIKLGILAFVEPNLFLD